MYNPFTSFRVTDDWDDHVARNSFGGGIDYAMPVGTPLPLPEYARVEFLPFWGSGGHTVRMTYEDGSADYYMHCSAFIPGDLVRRPGAIVALSGGAKGAAGAGNSDGPHLHAHGINAQGVRVRPFHGITTGPASAGVTPLEEEEDDMAFKAVQAHHDNPSGKGLKRIIFVPGTAWYLRFDEGESSDIANALAAAETLDTGSSILMTPSMFDAIEAAGDRVRSGK